MGIESRRRTAGTPWPPGLQKESPDMGIESEALPLELILGVPCLQKESPDMGIESFQRAL